MSIQALQMRVAERPGQLVPQPPSAGGVSAGGPATGSSPSPDRVQVSDQGRKLAAALATAEVELQLSPAKLREMVAAAASAARQHAE